jgi:7-keto-8-aminopelargonate synthetase-like enzyme
LTTGGGVYRHFLKLENNRTPAERGIYVIGCSYSVVPQGQARIRIQRSAAHTSQPLDQAARAFAEVGKELGFVS